MWVAKNKFAYQPKTRSPQGSLSSCYVLKCNDRGKVIAEFVGDEKHDKRSMNIWVPKIVVTNMQGPKIDWGPKSRN